MEKHFKNPSLLSYRNNELNEYRKIGKFTDLTLKSTDGKTMTVHKNILSAACPYFKSMFNSDLIESRQEEVQLLDDVTIADLDILIEYFYTGEATVSIENAENLYIKAQYFQLKELQQFCSDFLIDNISVQNCLGYWRNSVKYLHDNLKVECLKFITQQCKNFFEANAMDLTAEELKIILSEENLVIDQEELYKFVATWIKADFESRNVYLMDLIKNLDFTKISCEFIENEIMSDVTLLSNHTFSTEIASIMFQKFRKLEKQLNLQSQEKKVSNKSESLKTLHLVTNLQSQEKKVSNKNESSKNIHLVTKSGLYMLNWSERKWTKQFNFEMKKEFLGFAISASKSDFFISGGFNTQTSKLTKDFKSWNITSGEIIQLPQILEARFDHKGINFKEKIYCCGGKGVSNKGSTEIFDLENLKWNKGPTMNDSKNCFSLVTSDDSIYAFGGYQGVTYSNIVDQLDPREGKWRIISRDSPEISHAAILSNNFVYCFDVNCGGKIFDPRTNKWTDTLASVIGVRSENPFNKCDIVECNDEILGVFKTDNSKWGTFKYDHTNNKWDDLRIPFQLNSVADIRLCVTSEPQT